MALRRELTNRLIRLSTPTPYAGSCVSCRNYLASPEDVASRGLLSRFLQRRNINQSSSTIRTPQSAVRLPEFLTLPVGDKLREKLREAQSPAREKVDGNGSGLLTVENARKVVRAAQLEKLKRRLRSVAENKNTVSFSEFVQICADECGNRDRGLEYAKLLDETANVVVLGDIVFLRPEELAKSIEILISQSISMAKDPRKRELEEMEKMKAQIDKQAQAQVRRELYGGLGLMVAQTLVFMRLTFWELSWDVMEPVCFFATSLHLALAYTFFLRTSTEPSFEGFYQRRFTTKQAKLMKIHNFDNDKYEHLRRALNASDGNCHCPRCR